MAWFGRGPRESKGLVEDRPDLSESSATLDEGGVIELSGEETVAYLYKGSRVTGRLTFHGAARVDGNVDGEVLCNGILTIGEGAEIRAKVSGDVIVIHGQVEGDVTATDKIELGAPAHVVGNIVAPRVVVTEGVVFDGYCTMGGVKEKRKIKNPLSSTSEKVFEGGAPKFITTLEK